MKRLIICLMVGVLMIGCLSLTGCKSSETTLSPKESALQKYKSRNVYAKTEKSDSDKQVTSYKKEKTTNKKGQTMYTYSDSRGYYCTEEVDDKNDTITYTTRDKKGGKVIAYAVVKRSNGEIVTQMSAANDKKSSNKTTAASKNNKSSKKSESKKKDDFNNDDGWSNMY